MQTDLMNSIESSFDKIQKSVKEKVNFFMDQKQEMQQQLDNLQDSLNEVMYYMNRIEEKEEDNFFLLHSSHIKNKSEHMDEWKTRKNSLDEKIEDLNEKMISHENMNVFLFQIGDEVTNMLNKVRLLGKNIDELDVEMKNFKATVSEKINLCQSLINVDPNRCRLELSKLTRFCEK